MELNTGKNVDIIGQINVDNSPHYMCKLASPTYINGTLVSFIVLPQYEFKDVVAKNKMESEKIVVAGT